MNQEEPNADTLTVNANFTWPFRHELGVTYRLVSMVYSHRTNARSLVMHSPSGILTKRIERHLLVSQGHLRKLALFDAIVSQFDPDDLDMSSMLLEMLANNDIVTEAEKDNA